MFEGIFLYYYHHNCMEQFKKETVSLTYKRPAVNFFFPPVARKPLVILRSKLGPKTGYFDTPIINRLT